MGTEHVQIGDGRIHVIDHLRGFALSAILLMHAVENFSLYHIPEDGPAWLIALDQRAMHLAFLLFFGKAHAVFALLFGVSYHIQEQSNLRRNIPHRKRMIHRMAWLFIFGGLHGLFYPGDILCLLAIFGAILVFFAGLSSRLLFILAIIMALQPLLLWKAIPADPSPLIASQSARIDSMIASLSNDDFFLVLKKNIWEHRITEWMASFTSGRMFQIGAWTFMGLIAARRGYFTDLRRYVVVNMIMLCSASIGYVIMALTSPGTGPWLVPITRWKEMLLVVIYITAAMLIAAYWQRLRQPSLLSAYGRMSLTNYTSQGIIGAVLFYGFGAAFYRYGASFSLMIGVFILIAQLVFTYYWSKQSLRGPLEGLWARCVNMSATPR